MTSKKLNPVKKINVAKEKVRTEIVDLIKNKRTILIASIKNIPSSQFQEIVKKLRGKAIVKVLKKNLIFRVLDSSENKDLKKLNDSIKESTALLFSDIESFELAGELTSNKSPVKAKAGQESVKDIEIPAGPTELLPGPAISELGALGIQIKIEKGKINIQKSKIIVREGEKISAAAADVMNKFDIKPFSIGFVPLAAFDTQEEKLYLNIQIDKEKMVEDVKETFGKALAFSVEMDYISKDTISLLIRKVVTNGKSFEKFTTKVKISEDKKEEDKSVELEVKESEEEQESKPEPEQIQTPKENQEENK